METGITHVYELTGSKAGITARVTITEEYDALGNFSNLVVAVGVKSSVYKYTYYLSGTVAVNGTQLIAFNSSVPTHYVTTRSLDTYYRIRGQSDNYAGSPWSLENVAHETDGSKSVTVEINITGFTSGGGGSGWSVTDSRAVELTHIPRASTIGASDAFIGAVSTISVVRRNAEYAHSVAFGFGALSGYLDADGSLRDTEVLLTQSSIPFTIPESFYAEIPDSPSGLCNLTCRTYWQGEPVGEAQLCSFTVTAKREVCTPEVSGSVTDGNAVTAALTGDANKLVRFGSNAVCTITATAKNGASIVGKTIAGVEVEDNALTIDAVETGSVPFVASDSRGYSGAATIEVELIPYIHLTAVVTVKRIDPTSGRVKLEVYGNCYNGSFGAADNVLQIRCTVDGGSYLEFTPVLDGQTYSLQAELTGLDYLRSHTVEVEVTDCLEQVIKAAGVGKGIPVFDWGEEDFCFHVPVNMSGKGICSVADPADETDGANKKYVDTEIGAALTKAEQQGKANAHSVTTANMQVDLLSDSTLAGTTSATVAGGWSAGYRLYMIMLTMADTDTPMVQMLIPREQVAENNTGQIWSVSTAVSSKKLRIYHTDEDLIVETAGYTGDGGGGTAYIYGLFPEQEHEEEE